MWIQDPISSTHLSQLLTVVSKVESLRELFGFSSRKQFDKLVGSIPQLRNQVMHPVRPLVLSTDDVVRLKETIENVAELEMKATKILSEERDTNTRHPKIASST